jgi:hypothetical protein
MGHSSLDTIKGYGPTWNGESAESLDSAIWSKLPRSTTLDNLIMGSLLKGWQQSSQSSVKTE